MDARTILMLETFYKKRIFSYFLFPDKIQMANKEKMKEYNTKLLLL